MEGWVGMKAKERKRKESTNWIRRALRYPSMQSDYWVRQQVLTGACRVMVGGGLPTTWTAGSHPQVSLDRWQRGNLHI